MDDWPWNWFPPTCSLLRLPMETLQDIANQLSAEDLLAFCHVSRLTNFLSMKPLYREINMNTPSRTLLCCRTLRSNASAALHVRDLAVRCYSDDYSVSFFSTLYTTLKLLSGVTRLRFSILEYVPDSYHTGLQFCFFPNLRELRLEMQVSTPVLNFVYRNHRSLKELAFNSPPFDCDDDFPRPINAFPELVNFSGRCTLIPLIVPGAPLQDICTDIYSTEDADSMEDMEYALCELQRAGAPVDTFDILSDYWSYEFFAYLSEYVPNVQIIQYRTRDLDGYDSIVSWELLSEFTTIVTSVIGKFHRLYGLDLTYDGNEGMEEGKVWDTDCDLFVHDYELLLSWGQLCQSLKMCTLPTQNLAWYRIDMDAWVPMCSDPRTLCCVIGLEIRPQDLQRFPWLESFVEHLCECYSLRNPFEDARAVGINAADNDNSQSYEGNGDHVAVQAFLHCIRNSLILNEQN